MSLRSRPSSPGTTICSAGSKSWSAPGLALLRRPLGQLLRLAVRSSVGLAVLALFSQVSPLIGVSLGVNPINALVLGVLGAPGFGLLLMLQWALR